VVYSLIYKEARFMKELKLVSKWTDTLDERDDSITEKDDES